MSALQGTGIGTTGIPGENYGAFLARKPNEGKYPNPSELILGSSKTYIIDSRSRDKCKFPNPSSYLIKIEEPFKNVTSIELKGSLIPKTEYNVNSDNQHIPFNVVDSITNARILKPGFGYIDGSYGFGTADPTAVSLTGPALTGGTQAEVTVTVINNQIASVTIPAGFEGTGYLRGCYSGIVNDFDNGYYRNAGVSFNDNIPRDTTLRDRWRDAVIEVSVGQELVAVLTPGMYDFSAPDDNAVGLAREITTALQTAVQDALNNGVISPIVGGPTTGVEYFPYGAGSLGSTFLTTVNLNASGNANVVIQRGSDDTTYTQYPFLELLFGSTVLRPKTNASSLLGYGSNTTIVDGQFPSMDQTSGAFAFAGGIWASTPITARNDYNLTDSPKYVILEITPLQNSRIYSESVELSKGFALLAFDANMPEAIFRAPGVAGGTGDSNYTSLLAKPGILKGIKGADFDSKILSFGLPVAELSEFMIEFKTFGGNYYNFQGRENVLLFQLNMNDINSNNRF